MPTECERTAVPPDVTVQQQQQQQQQQSQLDQPPLPQEKEQLPQQHISYHIAEQEDSETIKMDDKETEFDEMSTSTTSSTSNGHSNGGVGIGKKTTITSPDPTAYVAKARVTRPIPPPPSYNPMQFVQIKPCNLYQTAQEQIKKAEEVKKIKEIKKEEPEDWQNNLDNWKSSRRKRVEHIIDRVVEVKKLELEEHDRSRKKSKTFNEMIEERGERSTRGRVKLASLAVYNEDESNDLSDLGIGTSSASGKSSLSEDFDNNSVLSDNPEHDKTLVAHNRKPPNSKLREYISSPGYDTSTSTAPASSPDPCEYTYEGAIQDYKQRVSRASSSGNGVASYKLASNNYNNNNKMTTSKESTPERTAIGNNSNGNGNGIGVESSASYPVRRGSKIEDRLMGFEVTSPSDYQDGIEKSKVDVPKIDISKRKEIFENQNLNQNNNEPKPLGMVGNGGVPKVMLRDRFKPDATTVGNHNSESQSSAKKEVKRLSGDITSIRDRLQSLEQQQNLVNSTSGASKSSAARLVDIPVPPLKERLSSLQNAVTKEEVKKPPVVLVDARQLEIMKNEEETAKQRMKHQQQQQQLPKEQTTIKTPLSAMKTMVDETTKSNVVPAESEDVDRDDSGIHTSDIEHEERLIAEQMQKEQEQQLNAAIAALAMEERQLEEAANAVNQIEAEFAELSSGATATKPSTLTSTTNDQPCEMEFSVSSTNHLLKNPQNISSHRTIPGGSSNSNNISVKEGAKYKPNEMVLGNSAATKVAAGEVTSDSACNLRRKPSNEMVHARNLLKMFKETFNNDIELDEADENSAKEETPLHKNTSPVVTSSGEHKPIVTQVFESKTITTSPYKETSPPHIMPKATGNSPSMIPRSINPIGKPPMSPKCAHYGITPGSPLNSPIASRKADNQFCINGRVEIFNSKSMLTPKPSSPTMSAKISYLPQAVPMQTVHGKPSSTSVTDVKSVGLPTPCPASKQHAMAATTTSLPATPAAVHPTAASKLKQPDAKSMPAKSVNEPFEIRSTKHTNVVDAAATKLPQLQHEVVVCAPPVTILNPDELPKPNTVKALSSCFSGQDTGSKATPPIPPPRPLPRSRIPQTTPPQSPKPAKRTFMNTSVPLKEAKPVDAPIAGASTPYTPNILRNHDEVDYAKTFSIASNISSLSSDSQVQAVPIETVAIIHSPPPAIKDKEKLGNIVMEHKPVPKPQKVEPPKFADDTLKPNETFTTHMTTRSEMPPLLICPANESTLYKLASAPHSPASSGPPASPVSAGKPSDSDIALFSNLVLGAYHSSGKEPKAEMQRQHTVDEMLCDKIDIRKMPIQDQVPRTSFADISPADIKRCDGTVTAEPLTPTKLSSLAKPFSKTSSSPIVAARAAHSKALIETCEKIIAEERQASNQMKSSLPSTPIGGTPIFQRKSKIPKAIPCCIGSSSMLKADDDDVEEIEKKETKTASTPTANKNDDDDDNLLIARLHVVETQIKVTTSTPPTSPKTSHKMQPNSAKKTKNIFDFIKKNFSHQDDAATPSNSDTTLSNASKPHMDTVNIDEIHTVDNSKFYIASDDITTPPPLPSTPAPVNIQITKKITTDEILEEALSQEISDLLDDELNKLNVDSDKSEKKAK